MKYHKNDKHAFVVCNPWACHDHTCCVAHYIQNNNGQIWGHEVSHRKWMCVCCRRKLRWTTINPSYEELSIIVHWNWKRDVMFHLYALHWKFTFSFCYFQWKVSVLEKTEKELLAKGMLLEHVITPIFWNSENWWVWGSCVFFFSDFYGGVQSLKRKGSVTSFQ